ncbi:heme ABC exporter ATP-binding protein CcmA [Parapontixanthobacter aurantiacus]|nr:heme ABC exporter ATP-binding protein CcmA [Parapontixanthobacter aurantiacus]
MKGENLSCLRGERLLFRRLDLTLKSGAALHVAGPNGIGKSSLLRILAGLLTPYTGSVDRAGGIALLDERLALDEALRLSEALGFWARIDDSAASDAMEMLGLAPLGDVPVRYLSTGQRKRAAFARLLMQDAPIWLLDEPLNGLDADAARIVEKLASQHGEKGGICIVASHQAMQLRNARTLALEEYAP